MLCVQTCVLCVQTCVCVYVHQPTLHRYSWGEWSIQLTCFSNRRSPMLMICLLNTSFGTNLIYLFHNSSKVNDLYTLPSTSIFRCATIRTYAAAVNSLSVFFSEFFLTKCLNLSVSFSRAIVAGLGLLRVLSNCSVITSIATKSTRIFVACAHHQMITLSAYI